MMNNYQVGLLKTENIGLMKHIIDECGYQFNIDAIKQFLSRQGHYIFVGAIDEEIIAFAYGYRLTRLDGDKPMLYLHAFQVLQAYQHLGFGTKLFEFIVKFCEGKFSKGFLIASKDNLPACKLYEKCKCSNFNHNEIVYVFGKKGCK